MNEYGKNVFPCIWSMFPLTFKYSTRKTGKYVEELSKLSIIENRIKKLLLVRFLLPPLPVRNSFIRSLFWDSQMIKKISVLKSWKFMNL